MLLRRRRLVEKLKPQPDALHQGELFEALHNVLNGSEFAGACFSHDGRFMFVNLQEPGLTCVVRGPWRKGQR